MPEITQTDALAAARTFEVRRQWLNAAIALYTAAILAPGQRERARLLCEADYYAGRARRQYAQAGDRGNWRCAEDALVNIEFERRRLALE